jgi:hypothetical protein
MFRGAANFEGYVCREIQITWDLASPDTVRDFPEWPRVVVSNVFFTASSQDESTGDPLDYLVRGDQAYLWFEKSGDTWMLVRWEDRPVQGLRTKPSTIGQIKALWRDPLDTWGLPQTRIENVISNLRRAMIERDPYHYQAQLADSFRFVFAAQDVGGPNNIPADWGRSDEIAAIERMFYGAVNLDGYVCQSVSLAWQAAPSATDPDFPDWPRVVVSNVFLSVPSRHHLTEDPLDYIIMGDQAYMWFEQSGGMWKVVRWEDRPIQTLGVESTTFGTIKGLWKR